MNLKNLPAGPKDKFPEEIYVVIEISKGSKLKYEYDEELEAFLLDRILYTSMHYPLDYGFIPSTLCEDGDPLDCLIISSLPLNVGTVARVRPVALLEMEDEKGKDEKLIGVLSSKIDPTFNFIKDVKDIPEALKNEIKHFFEHYKELEPGKWVKVKEWRDADYAKEYLKKIVKK
ncbi:MAG: inorganic diphosphatase [Candidatus Aenigmatarchaeota archaeon]